MNREDFLLSNKLIYFDSAATALKPSILATTISDYYNNYSANSSRGDYDIALKVDNKIDEARTTVKEFINASSSEEIIFTSGATASLNMIVFGYFKYYLKEDDEVLLNKGEHASNLLPWLELQKIIKFKIKYIPLNNNKLDNIQKYITNKTKVIALAHLTNVMGDIRPIKEITKIAHKSNILVVLDSAQSIAHIKTDVKDLDIDFLAFSAHKIYGPTGLGVLYSKLKYLEKIVPLVYGGGMNSIFEVDNIVYSSLPSRLEAGTINIAAIIGFNKVLEYINDIGLNNIIEHELKLTLYLVKELKKLDYIVVYNELPNSIVSFNYKNIFAQDIGIYLNKYNICVRSGNHCTKMLKDELGVKNTVRVSLGMYNTIEEIDKLIVCLKNPNIIQEMI